MNELNLNGVVFQTYYYESQILKTNVLLTYIAVT